MAKAEGVRQRRSKRCGCERCRAAYPVPERRPTKVCTGSWQARWYDAAGNRQAATKPTRKEVLAERDKAKGELATGAYVDRKRGDITVSQLWTTRLEGRTIRGTTAVRVDSNWRTHVRPRWGQVTFTALINEHQEIQNWVSELTSKKHLSPETVWSIFNVLDQLCAAAVRGRRMMANPCDGVDLPKATVKHPDERQPPNEEQLELICRQIAQGHYRRIVELDRETGMRWEEISAIPPECIDLEAEELHVRWVIEEINGRREMREYPKSDASLRTLPLTKKALRVLAEQYAEMPPLAGQPVFRGPRGGMLGRHNFRNRVWLPATIAAGVHRESKRPNGRMEHWPTFHMVRHRFGSRLENAGISRATLREIMGHKHPKSDVTERYMHGAQERRLLILRALGDVRESVADSVRSGARERKLVRRRVVRSSPSRPHASLAKQS